MINWNTLTAEQQTQILMRPASTTAASVSEKVKNIISSVKERGDEAVLEFTRQFDCSSSTTLKLDAEQLTKLADLVPEKIQKAIEMAYENIERFHIAQKQNTITVETRPGVICEQRTDPIESVGFYIPGGSAPLPSTVLMLGIPARIAGCNTISLCTPPNAKGLIAPEIAYAAKRCGIENIYLCGGAQAIAAMAFGTKVISKAGKIFGPGNRFVTEAKQQVSQMGDGAAIDMPAGPSEVLVLADENANPAFIAADLLSQAEHGEDSQAILVCSSRKIVAQVRAEINKQLQTLSRQSIAKAAMNNARYIVTNSVTESVNVSNLYAPEHLILQTDNARDLLPIIKNAGSIFLGAWSPESAGDYASGTNHVLPTYGFSRTYSSLGLSDFVRRYTVQEISKQGLQQIGHAVSVLAAVEGLDAHEQAVLIRLKAIEETCK
ncbi:histidinol dehydrogenase [Alteromonas sp. ASW11-130]|uniref:histidinol dehydrogenase n=1 Tax=Alteromonas sp. ASW11-130 TaxID=3015775 RepID=UPI0022426D55|nr:histidinol dehydrogenase [Alteromonas sp. ASW11-130]MCW8092526.1 histidinol dehydrogenase [Alteromonas sp. ASW11-130]